MKIFLRRFAVTLTAIACLTGSAIYASREYERSQPVVIGVSVGGRIFEFLENYDELRRSGRQVQIDGICISACTFVIGTVPWERICVTPFAKLAFHSASTGMGMFSKEGTRLAWYIYPPKVRELLRTKFNWDGDGESAEHPGLMYLEYDDLRGLLRSCA